MGWPSLKDLKEQANKALNGVDLDGITDAAKDLLNNDDTPKDDSCITVECFREEIQNDLPKIISMLDQDAVQAGLKDYGVKITDNPGETMNNLAHQMRKKDHLNSADDPVNPEAIANAKIAVKEEFGEDYPHLAVFVAATEEQSQAAMSQVFNGMPTSSLESDASKDYVMVYENADGQTVVFDANATGASQETQAYQEVDANIYTDTFDAG